MKERTRKRKNRIDDRAARMELSDHFVPEDKEDDADLEAKIRSQMSGVDRQLKRDDPDEMDEVYEQLHRDVSDEASEDDYEDESESEELLRRMPWLKYTAPEVLERASNRTYQYKGRRIGRNRAEDAEDVINPYAGEAFREAVDELRGKIMEAKESAAGEVNRRARGKVYVPPMREDEKPASEPQLVPQPEPEVVQFAPEPEPVLQVLQPEPEPQPVPPVSQPAQQPQPEPVELRFPAQSEEAVKAPQPAAPTPAPQVAAPTPAPQAAIPQPQPVPQAAPQQPAPQAVVQQPQISAAGRPAPQAPPPQAGPVPFTSSALFRSKEAVPLANEAQDLKPLAIDPSIKEDVRAFKQGIIDLDDDADIVERMREKLENERFEAEEALAEEVIAEEGAEEAFDGVDPVTNYAPDQKGEKKKTRRTLSAMERLKALAQTDEVEDPSVKGRRPKMTALDRLEQMEALDRQGIPYAAQHRIGEAGFAGMQMQQMQQMRMMPPFGVPMQGPMQGMPMGQPMMGQPMMAQPMMGQQMMGQQMMGQSAMAQPMLGQPYGAPMNAPMQGMPMNAQMMGQTMPLPQLPPLPPFTQGLPQGVSAGNLQGQPKTQPPAQGGGFDYNVSQGGGFDF